MDVILKPETTEKFHHVPVRSKNLFIDGSFRTIDISKGKGIKAIIGKLKTDPQGSTKVQKYLFDVNKWTMAEAQAWVKENKKNVLETIITLYKDHDLNSGTDKKIIKYIRAKVLNIDEENHRAKVRVSTGDIDRHKELILLSAWKKKLKSYKEHNVLLSSHDYRTLQSQIGEGLDIDINDKGMDIDFEWYAGQGNKEADWGWVLASKGKAMFSVGFLPVKTLEGDDIPKELIEKYKGELRAVYTEVELIEVSQVVVGSNRGALQMGIDSPDVEQCNYMYEVVRSFGKDIPDFEAVEVKKPEPAKPVIKDDSIIISPIEIKNMKDMEEFIEIWKSGRVISEKNRKKIRDTITQLQTVVELLDNLMEISEPKDGGGDKGLETDIDAFIERANKTIEKNKS